MMRIPLRPERPGELSQRYPCNCCCVLLYCSPVYKGHITLGTRGGGGDNVHKQYLYQKTPTIFDEPPELCPHRPPPLTCLCSNHLPGKWVLVQQRFKEFDGLPLFRHRSLITYISYVIMLQHWIKSRLVQSSLLRTWMWVNIPQH